MSMQVRNVVKSAESDVGYFEVISCGIQREPVKLYEKSKRIAGIERNE